MNYPEGWGLKGYVLKERARDHEKAAIYFFEHTENEPECCKHFGCGRRLYPQEKLFSDYCFFHKKILPNLDARFS